MGSILSSLYESVSLPIIVSFLITVILGPFAIPVLHRLKFGQTVRSEGPESHKAKTGTPTMGGILFLAGILITSLFYVGTYEKIIPVLLLTFGFGIVGFLDDYIKVVKKRSLGLRAWQKMGLQLIITGIFAYLITNVYNIDLAMKVPFFKNVYLDLGILNIPFIFIVVIGTDNGSNFTDGVDGLDSSVTAAMTLFFIAASFFVDGSVRPICLAVVGGLLGFLVFNAYPAKVFMGDTGALALGGFVAAVAYVLQLQLFLLIIGAIYVIEVLSVMIQVSYFKLTHGKRVFRMAPIHHHFELGGWSETKVVAVFTLITLILGAVALDGLW